jgi:hypothetical protein
VGLLLRGGIRGLLLDSSKDRISIELLDERLDVAQATRRHHGATSAPDVMPFVYVLGGRTEVRLVTARVP